MKLLRIFYLLFAVMLITTSCSRTNEQLLRAEQIVENAPDSAMSILNKFDYNKLSDKDKALYGLVNIRIRDKKLLSLEPDSFLNFSIAFYKQEADNELLAICYLFRGRHFFNDMKFEMAMKYYLMALDNQISNPVLNGKLFADIGQISMQQRDYNVARTKFLLAYENYKQAKLIRQAYNVLVSVGRTYTFEQKYDSAQFYYSRAIIETNDAYVKGNALQESGIVFFYKHSYDSAKYYLLKSIQLPYIKNNLAIRYYYLSEVCFELNETLKAQKYASKSIESDADIRTQRECFRILANCASRQNIINDIAKYMLFYQNCSDSIRKIDSQTKGSYIETMYNSQKEAAKSRNWIWYLLISIVFIISGSVYLYITKHKRAERKIKLNDVNHSQQKAAIRKDIMMKKQTSLLANIERIKTEQKLTEKGNAKFPERVKSIYNELLHIQDQALFFCEMDGALNNIISKLKTKAPDIKDKELIWCCLQLLDAPTHDILILLDYESVNSLKRMKGRLAIKLELENATLLNDYLLQLLIND
jgi:tetratricopeptide (TPR) repeat protein